MNAKFATPRLAVNPRDNPRLIRRYLVITPDMLVPIDCRVYRANTAHDSQRAAVYADIWIQHGQVECSGSGKAGSAPMPYDQSSAAVDRAIAAAGITLHEGDRRAFCTHIPTALAALADALGLTQYRIIT